MVAIAPGTPNGTLDDVLETLELTLETIDGLRARIDEVAAAADAARTEPPDGRPDRLLVEVNRLHRRVEEIAEASWQRAGDDRLQGALDAIDRLRIRVDDADPSASVLQTLDLVSEISARLDADDGEALTELALEAVEDLRAQLGAADDAGRAGLDRAVARLEELRLELEARDPAEAIELALEAMDDVGQRVDRRATAIEQRIDAGSGALDQRLTAIETSLDGLTALAGSLDGAIAQIADRVVTALMGPVERAIGASTERLALPPSDSNGAVVAQAAAAMSRLEGRLDAEFGSVERSVERLDRHVGELQQLMRDKVEPRESEAPPGTDGLDSNGSGSNGSGTNGSEATGSGTNGSAATEPMVAATGLLNRFRVRGRAARR